MVEEVWNAEGECGQPTGGREEFSVLSFQCRRGKSGNRNQKEMNLQLGPESKSLKQRG
jgi:hypothetical protein